MIGWVCMPMARSQQLLAAPFQWGEGLRASAMQTGSLLAQGPHLSSCCQCCTPASFPQGGPAGLVGTECYSQMLDMSCHASKLTPGPLYLFGSSLQLSNKASMNTSRWQIATFCYFSFSLRTHLGFHDAACRSHWR